MSALAVVLRTDGGPAAAEDVWGMLAAAAYAGPDGMHVRHLGALAMGHASLATGPGAAGEIQPLVSPRTGCVLVADARVDNREAVLAQLPGAPAASRVWPSDAQLILWAYEAWGTAAPEHLLGDFAFAVWDPRRRRLVCARDTSGQRRLFYRVDHRAFAAASEIHQLLQDSSVRVAPNEERIREFLIPMNTFQNEKDHPVSFYDGIYAVPAAHVLVADAAGVQLWPYWELQPPTELRYRRDEDYEEHFRELFFEAVGARLRVSGPGRVGALLSGGLDSSSVVCAAQELYGAGLVEPAGFTTFSSVFGELDCDERPLIETIQAKYGLAAEFVAWTGVDPQLQPEPRGFRESPTAASGPARDAILGAASGAGVRVLLTGDVADACIGGSRLVLDSLLRQGRIGEFRRHWRAYRRLATESWRKTVALTCVTPLLPGPLRRQIMVGHVARVLERNRGRLLPVWLAEPLRHELTERQIEMALRGERARRFANPAREAEFRLLSPPEVARTPSPWPIEIRRPFADRRLHEFLLAIPPEQKFRPHPDTDEFYAGSKWLLRRAMRGILPEPVRTRPTKTIFSAVLESDIDRHWPVYEAVFGPRARPQIAQRGYVDRARFWERLQELRAGNGRAAPDFVYLMQVVALETWLRGFLQPRRDLVAVPGFQPAAGPSRGWREQMQDQPRAVEAREAVNV